MFLKKCMATLLVILILMSAVPAMAAYNKPYYIEVDLTNQIVTVYNTDDNSIARQMLSSTGAVGHETIQGTYYLPTKDRPDERAEWYDFSAFNVYAKWATRIYGPYLFHAIPCYTKNLDDIVPRYVKQFGLPDSHGCVRLRVEDAYFIAKNCLSGTRTYIYESGELDEDLRHRLYESSYSEDDMTYQEFLGISENDLGRGSAGTEVMDLQYRLIDLGYYGTEEPDGKFDNEMVAAIKNVQKDLGLDETGIATESLLQVIYSDDAPVAPGVATIEEGKSGPVVKKLQTALRDMGLYSGPIDSILDAEVTEAVKKFQSACNYDVDGIVTAEIQHAIYYTEEQLRETFGEGGIPAVELIAEEINKYTIDAKANIIIRAERDTKSDRLGKVLIGQTVIVLGTEGDWANIYADGVTGYIYKKYLANHTVDYNYNLLYTGADGTSYRIGKTLQQYLSGAESFADEFADLYASEQFKESLQEKVDFVTVNTGSDDVKLNMRASASSDGEVLTQVPNGTELRVLSNDGEWTRVGYEDKIGYLMSQYLTFWQGEINKSEETLMTLDKIENVEEVIANMGEKATATVVVPVNKKGEKLKPRYYAEPKLSADKFATMMEGAKVEIAELLDGTTNDGHRWVKVNYLGQTGYMLDVCLQFAFEGA